MHQVLNHVVALRMPVYVFGLIVSKGLKGFNHL